MRERLAIIFILLHLPPAVVLGLRWMQPAVDGWFESGIGWWLLTGYGGLLALAWIALAAAVLRWRGSGGSTVPAAADDGDLSLPATWRVQLARADGVEISLSYRSDAVGLRTAPGADRAASFGVRGDQESHDDAAVVAWFADRMELDPTAVTVAAVGTGVSARFRRRVSWSTSG